MRARRTLQSRSKAGGGKRISNPNICLVWGISGLFDNFKQTKASANLITAFSLRILMWQWLKSRVRSTATATSDVPFWPTRAAERIREWTSAWLAGALMSTKSSPRSSTRSNNPLWITENATKCGAATSRAGTEWMLHIPMFWCLHENSYLSGFVHPLSPLSSPPCLLCEQGCFVQLLRITWIRATVSAWVWKFLHILEHIFTFEQRKLYLSRFLAVAGDSGTEAITLVHVMNFFIICKIRQRKDWAGKTRQLLARFPKFIQLLNKTLSVPRSKAVPYSEWDVFVD